MLLDLVTHVRASGVVVAEVVHERTDDNTSADAILDLSVGAISARFAVELRSRAPYPNELPRLDGVREQLATVGTPLLAVPFVTESLAGTIIDHGWSWADALGNYDLRSSQLVLRQRSATSPTRPTPIRLPQGTASSAIIRALIMPRNTGSRVQTTALATAAGVSQPRASQVLHQLRQLGMVTRDPHGWWEADRDALLDRFLADYRGPRGSEHHFYSIESPMEVALRASATVDPRILAVSADVGPDLVAGWRRPTTVILYMRHLADIAGLGLTPAVGPHDGNVIIRQPDDQSVFTAPPWIATALDAPIPLADPVQQLWDLHDLGGADRLEAAGLLHTWLLGSH